MTRHDAPSAVSVRTHSSRIGCLTLIASDTALLYCGYDNPDAVHARLRRSGCAQAEDTPARTAVLDRAAAEIDDYLAGDMRHFTLPVDLRLATPFCREVVSALSGHVPFGTTATYGELAHLLGRPRAARPVGTALGANPLCVVLPCHRVVGTSGKLTGYAGGLAAKQYLLDLESAGR